MTDRERMIDLLKNALSAYGKDFSTDSTPQEFIADFILANGVIVPPCKVGDTVYTDVLKKIEGFVVVSVEFSYTANGFEGEVTASNGEYPLLVNFENIGKTVFLTKDQAEQALKESNNGAL